MVDDRPEDTGPLPDSGRPKREPPTIDLEATEVSSETKNAADASSEPVVEPAPEVAKASVEEPSVEKPAVAEPSSRPVSPWIVAALRCSRGCAGDWRRLDAGLARDSACLRAGCPAA